VWQHAKGRSLRAVSVGFRAKSAAGVSAAGVQAYVNGNKP